MANRQSSWTFVDKKTAVQTFRPSNRTTLTFIQPYTSVAIAQCTMPTKRSDSCWRFNSILTPLYTRVDAWQHFPRCALQLFCLSFSLCNFLLLHSFFICNSLPIFAFTCSLSGNYCGNASFLLSRLRYPQSRTFPFFTSFAFFWVSSLLYVTSILVLYKVYSFFFLLIWFLFHFCEIFIVFNSVNYDR